MTATIKVTSGEGGRFGSIEPRWYHVVVGGRTALMLQGADEAEAAAKIGRAFRRHTGRDMTAEERAELFDRRDGLVVA